MTDFYRVEKNGAVIYYDNLGNASAYPNWGEFIGERPEIIIRVIEQLIGAGLDTLDLPEETSIRGNRVEINPGRPCPEAAVSLKQHNGKTRYRILLYEEALNTDHGQDVREDLYTEVEDYKVAALCAIQALVYARCGRAMEALCERNGIGPLPF